MKLWSCHLSKGILCSLLSFFFINCFSQAPVNDECSGAIQLTVNSDNSCTTSYTGGMANATESLPSCLSGGYGAKDVWFKFTAIASSQRIIVDNTGWNFVFQVYSGTCGNLSSIACVNTGNYGVPDVALLTNCVVGATYYIRVYEYFGNRPANGFSICISTTNVFVDNDDCSGAIIVTPSSGTSSSNVIKVTNYGATQSMPGCFGSAEDDVWFQFTATSTRHRINVQTFDNINPVIQVFSGSCSNLTPILCQYRDVSSYWNLDADLTNLAPGTTYYYRVYGAKSYDIQTNIYTSVSTSPPPPTNDEPQGAISIGVNNDNSCNTTYNGNFAFPTQSFPSCVATGYEAKDVWYKFTAVSSAQRITVSTLSGNNLLFQVYSGTADNLNSIACVNTGSYNEPDVALLTNLTVGNTYYMRVYNYNGEAFPTQTYQICINSTATVVDNDECTGALTVTPSSNASAQNQVTSNNAGATQSLPGCYGSAEDDVWYKFTATSTRHRVVVETYYEIDPVLQVFNGSCSNLNSIACRYLPGNTLNWYIYADLTNLNPGTTYYYRVYGAAANNQPTNITTYVVTPPLPPSNDECTGAIAVPVNSNATCSIVYSGNTGYATQSMPNCISSGYEAMDAWYKFTALSSSQRITLTSTSGEDLIFEVFSGTCGNLTSRGCTNNGQFNEYEVALLTGLTVGETYYIRVYRNFGGASTSFTFDLCIQTTNTAVDNDEPQGAFVVVPSPDALERNTVTGNNTGATQSLPGCFGIAEDDIWFKFIATSERHSIVAVTNKLINPVLEVFSGTPSSLVSMSCKYFSSSLNDYVDVDLLNLVPGTTYYYRVYGQGSNNVGTNIYTYIKTLPAPANLPVTFSSFVLETLQAGHLLKWSTANENNNRGFELQSSRNGIEFSAVSFIATKALNGNSSQSIEYSFMNNVSGLNSGPIYYRLKQTDLDGKFKFSNIISAIIESRSFFIYPNPTHGDLNIVIQNPDRFEFAICDELGKTIKSGRLNSNLLDVSKLRSGSYVLKLNSKDDTKVFRFVKID
jgi:hypothetical protein